MEVVRWHKRIEETAEKMRKETERRCGMDKAWFE